MTRFFKTLATGLLIGVVSTLQGCIADPLIYDEEGLRESVSLEEVNAAGLPSCLGADLNVGGLKVPIQGTPGAVFVTDGEPRCIGPFFGHDTSALAGGRLLSNIGTETESFDEGPEPEPFDEGPEPEPFDEGPEPEPFDEGPEPEPFDEGPEPEPFDEGPESEPDDEGAALWATLAPSTAHIVFFEDSDNSDNSDDDGPSIDPSLR